MTPGSRSIAWLILATLPGWLPGCGGESEGKRSEDIEGARVAAPSGGAPAAAAPSGGPGVEQGVEQELDRQRGVRAAVGRRDPEIVIRRGRARATVDLSSDVPVVTVGDGRYSLARPDGALDREEIERLLEDLEAAGPLQEIELEAPAETPGKLLEELVFFLEEKGKVPIVSSPADATE